MSNRYGDARRRAQLELRAAAAQFMVDAELLVRWLDELAGEPAPAHVLEPRHAEVLRCARAVEAALNHLVSLELLAAERQPEAREAQPAPAAGDAEPAPAPESVARAATAPKPRTRRTIDILGDPDKPKPLRPSRDADGEREQPTEDTSAPDAHEAD